MGIFGIIGSRNRWMLLWHGSYLMKPGIVKLIRAVLVFFLSSWIWGTGVNLAHFQAPTKTFGVVLALISIFLVILALWGVWQAFVILGIKRLVIIIIIAFTLLVAFNTLTIPDTRSVGSRILFQLSATAQQLGASIIRWAISVVQAPDEFLFAYSGQRDTRPLPPGFPTPNPNATPVQISREGSESLPVQIPTPQQEAENFVPGAPAQTTNQDKTPFLEIGGYVLVVNTGGQSLRARAEPGTNNEIVARFPAGARLLVLDGPIINGDFNWWKVRSEKGEEGWCADRWLAVLD